ncbi:MAG: Uncharacterized protein G01um101477_82 [Candidatus Doudnabacteria bacterium Gr01-1014_77]|uniref:Uncharacterized protein n=1 Tax=Candidatus Doudnabacteria bacterium Gr01-1014_77 TaxID=2017133 RepID=A0A554JDH1_9BACT|nr:MAG: Uncharacterized protein G01um101477_82 [Candidatus Doudnabacteria bacterium Gr01-1014_77]
MSKKIAPKKSQLGQTLIETLVAIFILVTGLVSALSLAVYSFQSSDNSSKQIAGTALARESIEGLRNMRDTNWLNGTLSSCADLGTGQQCYSTWQGNAPQRLEAGTYAVDYSIGLSNVLLTKNPSSYVLNYDPLTGSYSNGGAGVGSNYSRKVVILEDQTSPYTALNPRLVINATVWWQGRKCPTTNDPSTLSASCKVDLQAYLTNWKNY